jgi:hypothetical protein
MKAKTIKHEGHKVHQGKSVEGSLGHRSSNLSALCG